MSSYFPMIRGLKEMGLYEPRNHLTLVLAIYLAEKARYNPKRITLKDGSVIDLGTGETVVGRAQIAEDIGITKDQARYHLEKLEKLGFCTRLSTNRYTIVTLSQYKDCKPKKRKNRCNKPDFSPTQRQHSANTAPQRKREEEEKDKKGNGNYENLEEESTENRSKFFALINSYPKPIEDTE